MHMESTSLYMSMIVILHPARLGVKSSPDAACHVAQVWRYINATIFLASLDLSASSILIRFDASKS